MRNINLGGWTIDSIRRVDTTEMSAFNESFQSWKGSSRSRESEEPQLA